MRIARVRVSPTAKRKREIMRVKALEEIVRADVAEQRVAHAAGILDGAYGEEGGTWGEYVDTLSYWERREALTSERVEYITDSFRRGHARPRLTRQLVRLWFTEARTLPAPDPATRLTFDECESAGVDGTGRFIA
jgi:hypothetical protein